MDIYDAAIPLKKNAPFEQVVVGVEFFKNAELILIYDQLPSIAVAEGTQPFPLRGGLHQHEVCFEIEALRMLAVDAPDWSLDNEMSERIDVVH